MIGGAETAQLPPAGPPSASQVQMRAGAAARAGWWATFTILTHCMHSRHHSQLPAAMAGDEGDDGLFLNLALPEAPAPHVSRTQQRKQSWTQQRAAKARHLAARWRPAWLRAPSYALLWLCNRMGEQWHADWICWAAPPPPAASLAAALSGAAAAASTTLRL